VIGARSPDETGMLPITPLSGSPDAPRAAADPSATAFFAISAPKATRPSGGPSSGPGAFVPPPVQSMPAAYAPPQSGGGGVAGYGGAANAPSASPGNPFPVTETVRSTSSAAETRVQSQRVWAVVLGVMFLGGMAVLLVLAIILWNQFHQTAPAPAPVPTPVATVATTEPAAPDPEPEPVVKSTTKSSGTKKTTTTTAPSTPPPAPVSATGTLTVTFTGSPLPSTATLRCGDEGSFGRPAVSGGKVSFANVPTSGDCTLTPSSAFTYSAYRHMHGGRSYTCDVTNFQTSCN
jgi:hypothetical protein